jgi:hypothetical protein
MHHVIVVSKECEIQGTSEDMFNQTRTYKGSSDNDAESIILGVPDDVKTWHKGGSFVKVPHYHILLLQLEVVHHVLAVRVEAYKVYITAL